MQEFEIEFDEAKRAVTLEKRGLDFLDTPKIFAGSHMQLLDDRVDYGEPRYNSFGMLNDRNVVVTWTPRGNKRRIIAMRHYHEQELENRRRTLD